MLKILHLYPNINLACGISKSIYLIITNTNEVYQNYVFCLGGDGLDKYKKAGINIVVFPVSKRTPFQTLKIFFALFNFIRKQNINIVHSHHRYFDFLVYIISKIISIKTITSVQSKVLGKKLFSYKADCLIACSIATKEHLIKYFNINQERIKVIYNFVDPKEVVISRERFELRKELGIDEQAIVIGFIGRFSVREKGVDVLLEAFKIISHEYNNLKLIMIGDGDDKKYINNFINQNNLDAVILSPKTNIYDYLNLIDIVVLPSKVDPFPLVMIETGLIKKAFIGSDVDGIKEFIENGKDGFLFPAEKVDLLTEKLNDLISNPELRKKIGEELYNKVVNNFTSDKIIPLYHQSYQQLMKNYR
jgi:glycosyltransferase involved in cell wall biosynthesis